MKRADWIALAERCEAATGPDREIDGAIFDAMCAVGFSPSAEELARVRHGNVDWLAHYTASLDAITALVERELPGWEWQANGRKRFVKKTISWVHDGGNDSSLFKGYATNPALALCAALCRAKAEMCDE